MQRLGSIHFALLATLALSWSVPAFATGNCANGKVLYFKTTASNPLECGNSTCHKTSVDANNIQNASNNPGLIDQALDGPPGDPAMLSIRAALGLTMSDLDDIATWIFYAPTCPAGGGSPNLQAAPAPVSFASTSVGATSGTTTITITNVGTASALAVTATSSDPTHFPLSANTCSGVSVGSAAPNNTCSFAVAFHPTAAGGASGTITINRTGGTLTVGVSGTGASSVSQGQLSMNASLSFGNQAINTASAASSIAISNVGGSAVSVSNVSSNNPSEFTVTSNSCATVAAGGSCAVGVTFTPGVSGARSANITVVSNGVGSPQTIGVTGTGTTGQVTPTTVTVVEYHHASFDHYFITSDVDEIAILDSRTVSFLLDWVRTGYTFKAYANAGAPASSVGICRFFNDSAAFAPKSSHFYAPHGLGCEDTISAFPDWKLENDKLFNAMVPDASGHCPTGTIPVYRLYNNGMGGAPNHRFTISLAIQQAMLAAGYIAEPKGTGVGMCVPP